MAEPWEQGYQDPQPAGGASPAAKPEPWEQGYSEPPPSTSDDLKQSVKSGIAQGVVGSPGIIGNTEKMYHDFGRWLADSIGVYDQLNDYFGGEAPQRFPTSSDIINKAAEIFPSAKETLTYEPHTTAGKYVQAGTAAASDPLNYVMGPGNALRRAGSGFLSGVGAQAGSDLTGGSTVGRLAGGIAGSMAGGIRAAPTPRPAMDLDTLHHTADQQYRSLRAQSKTPISGASVRGVGTDVVNALQKDGFYPETSGPVYKAVDRLFIPRFGSMTGDELHDVRKQLGVVRRAARGGPDAVAASRAIDVIDRYITSGASTASENWRQWAKGERLQEAIDRAEGRHAAGNRTSFDRAMAEEANNLLQRAADGRIPPWDDAEREALEQLRQPGGMAGWARWLSRYGHHHRPFSFHGIMTRLIAEGLHAGTAFASKDAARRAMTTIIQGSPAGGPRTPPLRPSQQYLGGSVGRGVLDPLSTQDDPLSSSAGP